MRQLGLKPSNFRQSSDWFDPSGSRLFKRLAARAVRKSKDVGKGNSYRKCFGWFEWS